MGIIDNQAKKSTFICKLLSKHENEFVDYYNTDRPHSGLGNQTIGNTLNGKAVKCEERLGGLIKTYR